MAKSISYGNGEDSIDIKEGSEENSFMCGINAKYITELLNSMRCEDITMRFLDQNYPIMVDAVMDSDSKISQRSVVMPITLEAGD